MCISVEFIKKDTFVQAQKELYKCVSLSEFIKKDTFVQAQKELYKCVSLSEFIKKDTLVQTQKELFLHLYKYVFQMYFSFSHAKLE